MTISFQKRIIMNKLSKKHNTKIFKISLTDDSLLLDHKLPGWRKYKQGKNPAKENHNN